MSHHKRRSLRRRLWFTLSLPLFVIVLMGAIPSHQTVTRLEMAKAVATLLPGHLSPSDADVASLFTDISPAQGSDLRTTLERGLMQGYPDGSFRPHDPVRWAECLQTWTKLVLVTRPDLAAAGSETPWPESEMAILQRAEFPLPDSVQQRRFAAQVTSDEFDTLLDTTRRLLRIAPPTMTTASPDVEEAQATETATRQSDSPETKQTVQQEIAESLSTPQEPAAGFRLRGKLLDALSRKPVPEAELVIDQKIVPLTPDGEFFLEGLRRQQLIEVLITADGYQSLSFKHRVGYKSYLQLLLKPYRASLHLRLISAGTGEPVDGATITLDGKETPADWTGKASFSGLTPGYQKLVVAAPGYKPATTVVFVEEKTSQRIIKLQPASN